MENNKRKNKFLIYTHIKFTLITLFVCLLFLQGKMQEEPVYEMVYYVSLNGEEVGVIDPTKVARVALENAASVAGMFLTTECGIVDIPEQAPAAPAMPADGMM